MAEFPTFKGSWPWPWIESYCILSCSTHRHLPTVHTEFHQNQRNLLWTDGHTRPRSRPNGM